MMILGPAAVLCSTMLVLGYLLFIWWLDRYEREPLWLVGLAFLWGGFLGTALGCVLSAVMSVPAAVVLPAAYGDFFTVVVAAPLAEEFTKGLVFAWLVFSSHLDNETDGLIYGAAAGLGFAVVENLFYFMAAAEGGAQAFVAVVVMRTLFTALVHAISTALLGYAIGYVRHRELKPLLWIVPFVGYALAVLNHGLWNGLATISGSGLLSEELTLGTMGLALVLVMTMSAIMFLMTQLSLWREKKLIAKYLREEAARGVLPAAHAEIIPSWRRRRKKDWLARHIPHKKYVQAATLLAFRRYQHDTAAEKYRHKYSKRVAKSRKKVQALLAPD